MSICKQCGVELEDGMIACPLCGTPITENGEIKSAQQSAQHTDKIFTPNSERHLLQRMIWQITATVIFSAIAATLIIDIAGHKTMTWSIYPVTICTIVFSYALILAFWRTGIFVQFIGGWVISTLFLWILNFFWIKARWPTELAIPMLLAVNVVVILFIFLIKSMKTKGLNVLAFCFIAIAVLCLSVDGIISFYRNRVVALQWSAIVSACLLPVVTTLLFMNYRTKRSALMQKIFHT